MRLNWSSDKHEVVLGNHNRGAFDKGGKAVSPFLCLPTVRLSFPGLGGLRAWEVPLKQSQKPYQACWHDQARVMYANHGAESICSRRPHQWTLISPVLAGRVEHTVVTAAPEHDRTVPSALINARRGQASLTFYSAATSPVADSR